MKMSIRNQIMLGALIPMLALGFFIYIITKEGINSKTNAVQIGALVQYTFVSSGLVHELQKERGATAVYVGSGGTRMKNDMERFRRETDTSMAIFHDFIESFHAIKYSSEFSSKVGLALKQLNDLQTKRDAVNALSLTKEDIVSYYTATIGSFIQSFEAVVAQASHPQIVDRASAYVCLISAKEFAGIERANMCAITSANNAVSVKDLSHWIAAWKGQEQLFGRFESSASPKALAYSRTHLTGEIAEKVSKTRNTVFGKAAEGNFGVSGDEVFEVCTRRINALKAIEDFQAAEIQDISRTISAEATRAIVIYSAISAVTIMASVILALLNIKLATKITTLFRNLFADLKRGSSNVASASEQISASSQSLSESTSQQAASIEETSSTMEEIASMVARNADNASEASKLAMACNATVEGGSKSVMETVENGSRLVVEAVENGNRSVLEMAEAMKEIAESSDKIADIIKIIEGIAFQTNLLALNAAVEAARAGDHGRGFAVVAEEVRGLAQSSSGAAKDITSLIANSMKKSEKGMELVEKAKGAFTTTAMTVKEVFAHATVKIKEVFSDSVVQVKKVTDLANEIAAASEEQTNGIQQINKAIQQMDRGIQQNATNAEETASASEELSTQAQGLTELVNEIASKSGIKDANGSSDGVDRYDITFRKKEDRATLKRGAIAALPAAGQNSAHTKTKKDAGKKGDRDRNETADVTSRRLNLPLEYEF